MTIELTQEQQEALASSQEELPSVLDPRTNTHYALVPLAEYDVVRKSPGGGPAPTRAPVRFLDKGRLQADDWGVDEEATLTDRGWSEEMPLPARRTVRVRFVHRGPCPLPADDEPAQETEADRESPRTDE